MSPKPSLLEELGLDETTLSWWQLALCGRGNMDLNWFYDDYESDTELAKAMDQVCLSCPVMKECLMAATDNKDYGLRGGIFLSNGKPDRMRNEHKTDEIWARIQSRLR